MRVIYLHERQQIERFFRRNTFLHIYSLGDLDDFFWPYTCWYALEDGQQIVQIALLYIGTAIPTLVAISEEPTDSMDLLLREIAPLLPQRFHAHLNAELVDALAREYSVRLSGQHDKMGLMDMSRLANFDTSQVVPLSVTDGEEVQAFYAASYPGNWFDARMLETGFYYGLHRDGQLVSVAGVHVYSPTYRVAALGNVATHPAFRGQRLAQLVCAKTCQALSERVDHIGLNVKADNISAIRAYEHLGFERIAPYVEGEFERR